MKLRTMMRLAGLGLGLGLFTLPATAQVAPDHPGRAVYNKSCAMCHDNPGATRAATLASIQQQAPARLREVLTTGVMAPMAASLSPQEVTDVIAFLTHLAEFIGPDARFVHQGMTSSDVLDAARRARTLHRRDILVDFGHGHRHEHLHHPVTLRAFLEQRLGG